MTETILPGSLRGEIPAIGSKSAAHRLLICAALAKGPTQILCRETSNDIEATRMCLAAMKPDGTLPCGESGSTLRFLLPVAAALGLDVTFEMEGRLPQRPMGPLEEQLSAHGITVTRPTANTLAICGQLTPGDYVLPGNVSSQFISGLLFALPLLDRPSTLTVTGNLESGPYVDMTLEALAQFGVEISVDNQVFSIPAAAYRSPGTAEVEGDWSNAAFWLCAGALGGPVTVTGLRPDSLQGDKVVFDLLRQLGAKTCRSGDRFTVSSAPLRGMEIDAAAIPDLVPILAVTAAAAEGETRITNAGRLRLKESDRLETVHRLLLAMGADAEQTADGLIIRGGKPLTGGTIDSFGDHRIAMAAAIAGLLCPMTVTGAEAVAKSYPNFWRDYRRLQREEPV